MRRSNAVCVSFEDRQSLRVCTARIEGRVVHVSVPQTLKLYARDATLRHTSMRSRR